MEQQVFQLPLSKDGTEAPAWQFVALAGRRYKIANAKSGKVLTAVKDEATSEAHIITARWRDADEQKWRLDKIDPKALTI